ncbi:MAG: hypothetical protein Kow0029_11770 [Candidatus Rifleibacteriota bacterium]
MAKKIHKTQNDSKREIPSSLYAAFDTFPAPKGAAVHIREFASTLFRFMGNGLLLVLGNEELPSWQIEEGFEIRRLVSDENNYLRKAFQFYDFVRYHTECIAKNLKIAHFRDPWSGSAILDVSDHTFKTVFEVNALPSIELPARYSGVGANTLEKIRKSEMRCLAECDYIVCPSLTIRNFLQTLGVQAEKISVIPNGAEVPEQKFARPETAPDKYLIYFGAVQSWQGIEILFKAMKFLRDFHDLYLVLCVSGAKDRLKYLRKLADRMEIGHRLVWNLKMNQLELQPWIAHASLSIAPLVECSRNLVQGCCPLKIVESMSHGIPVVSSDLPVVRELIDHGFDGWLVRPDRPSELARAIRLLLLHPEKAEKIGVNGQNKIKNKLSWQICVKKLENTYRKVLYSSAK